MHGLCQHDAASGGKVDGELHGQDEGVADEGDAYSMHADRVTRVGCVDVDKCGCVWMCANKR